jgi:hypothetical protein
MWNQLPEHLATAVSLEAFKGRLVMGPLCDRVDFIFTMFF